MTNKFDFYKCDICQTIIEVVEEGAGELVCCNQPMRLLVPHEQDLEKLEHHLPVIIEETENYRILQVGKTPHPMTSEHHIKFVELYSKNNERVFRHYFKSTDEPVIKIGKCFEIGKIAAYCNVHGLWVNSFE